MRRAPFAGLRPWPGSRTKLLDGIDLILLDLDRTAAAFDESWLSSDELARAGRFRFVLHRDRYVKGRICLRGILADLIGLHPADLRFGYGEHGKPFLEGAESIGFNMAHSGARALIGVGRCTQIGVDIEEESAFTDLPDLAERHFSPAEFETWRSLPVDVRQKAFFLAWTRKEAFIKATGEGMSRPLDSFDVELRPGKPARFRRLPSEFSGGTWSLLDIDPGAGAAAAVAVEWDRSATAPQPPRLWSLPSTDR